MHEVHHSGSLDEKGFYHKCTWRGAEASARHYEHEQNIDMMVEPLPDVQKPFLSSIAAEIIPEDDHVFVGVVEEDAGLIMILMSIKLMMLIMKWQMLLM